MSIICLLIVFLLLFIIARSQKVETVDSEDVQTTSVQQKYVIDYDSLDLSMISPNEIIIDNEDLDIIDIDKWNVLCRDDEWYNKNKSKYKPVSVNIPKGILNIDELIILLNTNVLKKEQYELYFVNEIKTGAKMTIEQFEDLLLSDNWNDNQKKLYKVVLSDPTYEAFDYELIGYCRK